MHWAYFTTLCSALPSCSLLIAALVDRRAGVAEVLHVGGAVIGAVEFGDHRRFLYSAASADVFRPPGLEDRQYFLGEHFESALGDVEWYTAKPERRIELEFTKHIAPRFQLPQDAVGRAPNRRLHKPGDRPIEPALARDLRLLGVGVVAFYRREVFAEKFVMMEIALDKFPHVFPRVLLGLRQVRAADAEIGDHHVRRRPPMEFPVQFAVALDRRQPHVPRPVGEHDHMRAKLGGSLDQLLARRDAINAAGEIVFGTRPEFDPRLRVILAVPLDKAGAQCLDDHRGGFIKALARLVHCAAKRRELAPRQTAPQTQPQFSFAQQIEDRRLLGDAQRVVPRHDHRRGAEPDARAYPGEIGHQLQIVGAERVIEKMMLGRPQRVKAGIGGEPCQPDFLVPHLIVADVLPAIAGEHHHHADIHGLPPHRHVGASVSRAAGE